MILKLTKLLKQPNNKGTFLFLKHLIFIIVLILIFIELLEYKRSKVHDFSAESCMQFS